MNCSILIVHRLRFVREGLIQFLGPKSGVEVVANAGDGTSAVELAGRHRPHLAMVDHDLADIPAFELTRILRHREPPILVAILGMRSDLASLTRFLQAGATGFLREDFTSEELVKAVKSLVEGDVYLSKSLQSLKPTISKPAPSTGQVSIDVLTDRQREILALVADGRSTKEIASDLSISPKTVDTHRKDLMARLNIYSVAQLTKFAVREGLTTLVD